MPFRNIRISNLERENRLSERPRLPQPIIYTQTRSIDVPISCLRQHRIITPHSKGAFTDGFKILRTQIIHKLREQQWNTLAVTSPRNREGENTHGNQSRREPSRWT